MKDRYWVSFDKPIEERNRMRPLHRFVGQLRIDGALRAGELARPLRLLEIGCWGGLCAV